MASLEPNEALTLLIKDQVDYTMIPLALSGVTRQLKLVSTDQPEYSFEVITWSNHITLVGETIGDALYVYHTDSLDPLSREYTPEKWAELATRKSDPSFETLGFSRRIRSLINYVNSYDGGLGKVLENDLNEAGFDERQATRLLNTIENSLLLQDYNTEERQAELEYVRLGIQQGEYEKQDPSYAMSNLLVSKVYGLYENYVHSLTVSSGITVEVDLNVISPYTHNFTVPFTDEMKKLGVKDFVHVSEPEDNLIGVARVESISDRYLTFQLLSLEESGD